MKVIIGLRIWFFEVHDHAMLKSESNKVPIEIEVAGMNRTGLILIEKGHRDIVLRCIPEEEVTV